MSEAKGFWALVEVMGHHKFAGRVTEATIAATHVLPMPDDCSACDLPKPEPRVVEAVEPQPRAWTPDPLDGDDVPF